MTAVVTSPSSFFFPGSRNRCVAVTVKIETFCCLLVIGQYFPVKAKLLRPCIALTSAVMAGRGVHEDAVRKVNVQVDCCTFDRVLLYLEASAKGKPFDIEPGNLDDM